MRPRSTPFAWAVAALVALAAAVLPAGAAPNDRVALLIGNNKYGTAPLRNAVNDARDLADSLKDLGFRVIVREDATRKEMIEAIREFGQALEGANVALFFYAGHGMQFKDRNYLIPIDIAMGSEEDVTFFALDVQQVFDRMDRARTRHNFIILDACRDNPFASSFKVTNAGLAQMSAPSGTLIAYATAPGALAQDGFSRNGMYTKHILQQIKVPDVPVEIMFKRVREGVERETLKRQTPWDSSSLKGDFAFNATAERAAASKGGTSPSADVTLTLEREFWASARESNRPEDIQAYLDKYPSGTFAPLARNRLQSLAAARPADPVKVAAAPPIERKAEPPKPEPVKAEPPRPEPAKMEPPKPEAPKSEPPKVEATTEAKVEPKADPKPEPPAPAAADKPVVVAAAAPTAPKDDGPGRELAPGIREVTFPDGAIYRGGLRGTLLHGKGQYVTKAFKYDGEFKDGLKEGVGTYVWENGNRYEGPFTKDAPNGIGKYDFANGDTYTGEVKAGALTGRGTYVTKSGDTMEGTFVDGSLHGVGIHRFASGDRYEGELARGKPHGKGRYIGQDGHRVEGDFADGQPHGKGTFHFANGDRYEGDIARSELTGQGAYFYKSGLKYEGQMAKGQPQGDGVFWFADGSRFEGRFEGGLAKATGRLVKPDGTSSPAEIVNGQARVTQ